MIYENTNQDKEDKREDKKEDKENKLKSLFKKHFRFIIIMAVIAVLIIITVISTSITKLTLNQKEDLLTWKYNKNIGTNSFVVIKNDKEVSKLKENQINIQSINDTKPKKIDSINEEYYSDGVVLSWKAPEDSISEDNYYVKVEDSNGKTVATSNKISIQTTNNIKEYLVKINGKEYKTDAPMIKIITNQLTEKAYSVEIVAIDNNNNTSEPCISEIDVKK